MKTVKVKLKRPECLPERGTPEAAGYDLKYNGKHKMWIASGEMAILETGVKLEMPVGMEAQVRPRSGLMFKHGIVGMFGTVDSDYRGEIKVLLWNGGISSFVVNPLDRIAQLVFSEHLTPRLDSVDEFTRLTTRGDNGFGHTGVDGKTPVMNTVDVLTDIPEPQILDSDIATVEALRDLLIDKHGYETDFVTIKRAQELIAKMYQIVSH